MEPKFTPGPCKAAPYSSIVGCPILAQFGFVITDVHLIAAAPELFKALTDLLFYVEQLERIVYSADDTGDNEAVAKAKAALAKALGKAA